MKQDEGIFPASANFIPSGNFFSLRRQSKLARQLLSSPGKLSFRNFKKIAVVSEAFSQTSVKARLLKLSK